MAVSKCDIAIWCLLGALIGWLVAVLPHLWSFSSAPPWRYWPYETPVLWLSLLVGLGGTPIAGLRATRSERVLWNRILVGGLLGSLLSLWLQPGSSYDWTRQVRVLAVNPFFEFRTVTWVVFWEQLGAVVAVALKGIGQPGEGFRYSLRAMFVVIVECAVFFAVIAYSGPTP